MKNIVEEVELEPFTSDENPIGEPLIEKDLSLIGHVDVEIDVKVGSLGLSIAQLFSMKSGEVFAMKESINSPVSLCLNNKIVALGRLVVVDDRFGVKITEIVS